MSTACNTGAPAKDAVFNNLCTQRATVGNLTASNIRCNFIIGNNADLPERNQVFVNGSTLARPAVITLNMSEISEIYDAEAKVLHTWPNLYNPSGNTGFQIAIGGLFYSFGSDTTGTYFQWNDVNIEYPGTYALRGICQTASGNGQYTVFVDGTSTNVTQDLSATFTTPYNVYDWSGFELTKGLHTIRLEATAPGSVGGHCDFGGSLQPFLLVQIS